jgi:molybdate transport system regulatory protein
MGDGRFHRAALAAGRRRERRDSAGHEAAIVSASVGEPMALSARNHLHGTVKSVETDGLMAEVVVDVGDGQSVTAIITSGSVERLGIEAGDDVDAVVKATEVMISK